MALTGVLRAGFVQIRVLEMDEALAHYVDRIGLDLVEKADDGRVYLSGYDEFDRHSIVLREADAPGVDFMAFKVAGDADLDAFEKRIADFGLAVDRVLPRMGLAPPDLPLLEPFHVGVRLDEAVLTARWLRGLDALLGLPLGSDHVRLAPADQRNEVAAALQLHLDPQLRPLAPRRVVLTQLAK